MEILAAAVGAILIFLVMIDVFQTIVLPRRASRVLLLSRRFTRGIWMPARMIGTRLEPGPRREAYLSIWGPLTTIVILLIWIVSLLVGFALLHFAVHSQLLREDHPLTLMGDFYMSAATLFAFGDVTPVTAVSRALDLFQAGLGIGIFALVISYLPVLYDGYSTREVLISRLDEWAGSPPTAGELLRRLGEYNALEQLLFFFDTYEEWASELLESHLSYPWLGLYRSQHDDQSWVAALTMLLDSSALVLAMVAAPPKCKWSAQRAFAIGRHTAVDLAQSYRSQPVPPQQDRLPRAEMQRLRDTLSAAGIQLRSDEDAERELVKLRGLYEPYVNVLSDLLAMPLQPWIPGERQLDDWEESSAGDTDRLHF
jgi:hypothetical protein